MKGRERIISKHLDSGTRKRLAGRLVRRHAGATGSTAVHTADVVNLLSGTARTLRMTAGRVVDRRVSSRLRRMANRRTSWSKTLRRTTADTDPPISPYSAQGHADASLTSCLAQDRAALMLINEIIADGPRTGRIPRLLRRIRDQLERDTARLRSLIHAFPDAGTSARVRPGEAISGTDTSHP